MNRNHCGWMGLIGLALLGSALGCSSPPPSFTPDNGKQETSGVGAGGQGATSQGSSGSTSSSTSGTTGGTASGSTTSGSAASTTTGGASTGTVTSTTAGATSGAASSGTSGSSGCSATHTNIGQVAVDGGTLNVAQDGADCTTDPNHPPGAGGPGAPCTTADDCDEPCCPCAASSNGYSAAACVGGTCQGSACALAEANNPCLCE